MGGKTVGTGGGNRRKNTGRFIVRKSRNRKAGTERRETDAEIKGRTGKRAEGTGEENGQNNGTETEQQWTKRVDKSKRDRQGSDCGGKAEK